MRKIIGRVFFSLFWATVTYLIGVSLLFLNYNWVTFTQFVHQAEIESLLTLIIPAFISGGVGIKLLFPRPKTKAKPEKPAN